MTDDCTKFSGIVKWWGMTRLVSRKCPHLYGYSGISYRALCCGALVITFSKIYSISIELWKGGDSVNVGTLTWESPNQDRSHPND